MKEPSRETASSEGVSFRWRYILLPLALLLLSTILTAYFYHLLLGEVAYHFKDGAPDKWLNRGAIIAWMLTPQFFFTLLAGVLTWGITRFSARFQPVGSSWLNLDRLVLVMGNMVALPQIILFFAMLDIFSYNSFQVHLLPLWATTLVVLLLGGIVLGIYFIGILRETWRTNR